jgi:hypothetical protein
VLGLAALGAHAGGRRSGLASLERDLDAGRDREREWPVTAVLVEPAVGEFPDLSAPGMRSKLPDLSVPGLLCHERLFDTQRVHEVDGVLADVALLLERRRDVDGRIGDEQRLGIGRQVHGIDVADPPLRPELRVRGHHRPQQLVGVQATV